MNKLICVFAEILYAGLVTSAGFAQSSEIPSNETLEQWKEFKEKYGENWQVRWNKYTGVPEKIFGYHYDMDMGEVTDESKAMSITKEIIKDNEILLKAVFSELKLERIQNDSSGWIIDYRQLYNSVPVHTGEIRVLLTNNGELRGVLNNFYPNISLSTTPVISENESIEIAKDEARSLGSTIDNSTEVREASLMVFPKPVGDSLEYYLTWKVSIHSPFEWGYEFFVDAQSAEIVHADSTVKYISDGNKQTSEDDSKLVFIGIASVVGLSAVLLILRKRLR